MHLLYSQVAGYALIALLSLGGLASCQKYPLQTVQTGDILLPEQDPKYSFTRNQESSVDIQEPQIIKELLTELSERFLDEAQIRTPEALREVQDLLQRGRYGYAPSQYICTSERQASEQDRTLREIGSLINATARISGLGAEQGTQHRRREAKPGQTGYIGSAQSRKLTFVDERGLVVAEALQATLLGAIYLDKILNIHLDETAILNPQLTAAHEANQLIEGANYTALEHHWDLAYGYYTQALRPLASKIGVLALRGVARRIDIAFTHGRIDINYHLYDELPKHIRNIRRELTRILILRLEHLLLGGNTLANLREDAPYAFPMLSEAYGLLHSLQYLRDEAGNAYYTAEETRTLQAQLLGNEGLWASDRLLQNETTNAGILSEIVHSIKERIKLDK